LFGADPVGGVAELPNLVDDRRIDRAIELVAPERVVDSDLGQLVAQLYIPAQLTLVGDVTDQVAARGGRHIVRFGAAHAWHSSEGADRSLPRLVEIAL